MRMRDIQMYLSKFTNGNKGTAISDCEVFLEMENGKFLIPKEDYARMKEAGLLEKEPDRTAFGSIGLDFEERE